MIARYVFAQQGIRERICIVIVRGIRRDNAQRPNQPDET
jgi:hypothetical protein